MDMIDLFNRIGPAVVIAAVLAWFAVATLRSRATGLGGLIDAIARVVIAAIVIVAALFWWWYVG